MDISDKDNIENRNFDANERNDRIERWHGERRVSKRRHRHHHRRRKLKKTAKSLLIVSGISFCVALLITYITGNLPNIVEKIISKNLEKAIERTTGINLKGTLTKEKLEALKNIDLTRITDESLRNLGGWEGDRGEGQSPDKYKVQHEEYFKQLTQKQKEDLKSQWKTKRMEKPTR